MNAIFAVNSLDGFGTGDDMPWPRSDVDLKRFRDLTMGNTVVMGANTWRSNMPKPLPGRRNCVLSKTLVDDRCEVFDNATDLLMNIKQDESVWIIGGAKILWLFRNNINTVYLTRFNSYQQSVITMNTADYLSDFSLSKRQEFHDHVFDIYVRNQ